MSWLRYCQALLGLLGLGVRVGGCDIWNSRPGEPMLECWMRWQGIVVLCMEMRSVMLCGLGPCDGGCYRLMDGI